MQTSMQGSNDVKVKVNIQSPISASFLNFCSRIAHIVQCATLHRECIDCQLAYKEAIHNVGWAYWQIR